MKTHPRGYALFEVVLAVAIFGLCVLKLQDGLTTALDIAGRLNQRNAVRVGLRTFIEETRRKEVGDMSTEAQDERLGATFSSTLDNLSLTNRDGTVLSDLYVLHAKATWGDSNSPEEETVDLYVYKPQIDTTKASGTDGESKASGTQTQAAPGGGGAAAGGGGAPGRDSRGGQPGSGSGSAGSGFRGSPGGGGAPTGGGGAPRGGR